MSEEQKQTNGRPKPEIRGKVLAVLDEWRNNTGTFWKREVVVETGLRFPNPLKVTFQKDATSHLEGVAEGDCVIIPYVLNGREYDGRYYVDIVGMGQIGLATARVLSALGCRVIGTSFSQTAGIREGFEMVTLPELLLESDARLY